MALVITANVLVYPIELGIRLLTGGSGKIEYLVVALIIIALLLVVGVLLYGNYKREKTGTPT
jgi:hypothetical protein